jgi:predicted dehydrogenase
VKPLRAAIVGLGRIGSLLEKDGRREKPCTHAGAIAASGCCILVGGADTDEERRQLFAKTWKVPVYADAGIMLAEQRPDILHIATHPDSHYLYCALAARYGVKAAVCEKPLAATLAEARKIAALHKSGKITIVVNHERRYAADYRKAKAVLDSGRLGILLSVKAALYMGKGRRLLDVLWHDGTHLADAAVFLTGGLLRHKAAFGVKLTERTGTAYLEGELVPPVKANTGKTIRSAGKNACGKVPFLMELGAGRDYLVFELEFSCERGRLRIGNGVFEVWESVESPYAEGFQSLKQTGEGFAGPTGYFSGMVEDAAACARKKNAVPVSGALDGLRVIEYLNSVGVWHSQGINLF